MRKNIGNQNTVSKCPVCCAQKPELFMNITPYQYFFCAVCEAKFLTPKNWLSREDEYKHYLTHENDADDPNYQKFVSKLMEALLPELRPNSVGLDYGCGPSSALAKLLIQKNFQIKLYDPFFEIIEHNLTLKYDFITCSETVEHFYHPSKEFSKLDSLLKPGGWLGIMTQFQTDNNRFKNWNYRRDPTHVVFYRERTFDVIAKQRGWTCQIPSKDIVLMQKTGKTIRNQVT